MCINVFFINFASSYEKSSVITYHYRYGFRKRLLAMGPRNSRCSVGHGYLGNTLFVLSAHTLFIVTLAAVIIFTWLGTWATARLMPFWGDDPKRVVMDEMVGVWIPLLACPSLQEGATAWWWAIAALILFRFFDILKPLGIRRIDRMHGAFYVMLDDIVAGIYSVALILLAQWVM